jgi:hypothetical protein
MRLHDGAVLEGNDATGGELSQITNPTTTQSSAYGKAAAADRRDQLLALA